MRGEEALTKLLASQKDQSVLFRFNLVDKRNQKSIQRILESTKEDDPPAYLKAKDFYQSCLNETEEMELINKRDMLAIIEDAGGCQITGNYDSSLSFDWRVQKLQNQLGEF